MTLIRTHLGSKSLSDLPQYVASLGSRHSPEELERFARLFQSSLQLLWRCLQQASKPSLVSFASPESLNAITYALYLGQKLPVAGHTLSNTSPLPPHRPSYTPEIVPLLEGVRSSALRTVDARVESKRERCPRCTLVVRATRERAVL